MARVLIVTNHNRRFGYFDATIEKLKSIGDITVNATGEIGCCDHFKNVRVLHNYNTTYDMGMVELARAHRNVANKYDYVFLVDNDLFITSTDNLVKLLSETIRDNYDLVTHVVSPVAAAGFLQKDQSSNLIHHIDSIRVEPTQVWPYVVPEPHMENAYTLIKASLWDTLAVPMFSHSRVWFCEMLKLKAKFGHHKAVEYRSTYSHKGPGWFHVGNLMSMWHRFEAGKSDMDLDSFIQMSRLGFMFTHKHDYPGLNPKIDRAVERWVGIEDTALKAWAELTKE